MGEVYRARDKRLDRTVAIKVLPSHLAFLILLIALAATFFPARCAAQTDVAVILRSE